MDAELKTRWVEALRSGEYNQFRGGWGTGGAEGMCCLNVLCVVKNGHAIHDTLIEKRRLSAFDIFEYIDSPDTGNSAELIDMNDNGGSSFEEIADWIEVNL